MKTVTSLQLSKQLKDAGFAQRETIWYWFENADGESHVSLANNILWALDDAATAGEAPESHVKIFAAPTAEEILEKLHPRADIPTGFDVKDGETWELYITHWNGKWQVAYVCDIERINHAPLVQSEEAETLADAAAKMYVYLHEQGLLPSQKEEK